MDNETKTKLGGVAAILITLSMLAGRATVGDAEKGEEVKPTADVVASLERTKAALEYIASGGRDTSVVKRALSGEPDPVPAPISGEPKTTGLLSAVVEPKAQIVTGVTLPAGYSISPDSLVLTGAAVGKFEVGKLVASETEDGSVWVEIVARNTSSEAVRFEANLTYGATVEGEKIEALKESVEAELKVPTDATPKVPVDSSK